MTIAELIELRKSQQADEYCEDMFFMGYTRGWQDAYDDIKTILEHYGFDMGQEVKQNDR